MGFFARVVVVEADTPEEAQEIVEPYGEPYSDFTGEWFQVNPIPMLDAEPEFSTPHVIRQWGPLGDA